MGCPSPRARSWAVGFSRHVLRAELDLPLQEALKSRLQLSFTCSFVASIGGTRGLKTDVRVVATAAARAGPPLLWAWGHRWVCLHSGVAFWCHKGAQKVLVRKRLLRQDSCLEAQASASKVQDLDLVWEMLRVCAVPERGFRASITFWKGLRSSPP